MDVWMNSWELLHKLRGVTPPPEDMPILTKPSYNRQSFDTPSYFLCRRSTMTVRAPSPVTLQAVPKESIAM